jgi:hypothetical protein
MLLRDIWAGQMKKLRLIESGKRKMRPLTLKLLKLLMLVLTGGRDLQLAAALAVVKVVAQLLVVVLLQRLARLLERVVVHYLQLVGKLLKPVALLKQGQQLLNQQVVQLAHYQQVNP